jgi:hypothetical protein
VPEEERGAKEAVLSVFANRELANQPADAVEVMLHSMAHVLLRALDDGQIGFAEASLAEWLVPETLTFALFANSLKSLTLGSLWTLINHRVPEWLEEASRVVLRCENDPICYQRSPRSCERCLYLTFGCQRFNEHLDRAVLASFWQSAGREYNV